MLSTEVSPISSFSPLSSLSSFLLFLSLSSLSSLLIVVRRYRRSHRFRRSRLLRRFWGTGGHSPHFCPEFRSFLTCQNRVPNETSEGPGEYSRRPQRVLKKASKVRSVLSFSDSETFLESDLLPTPSKSTQRQVQFSRGHSVVLRLHDERDLAAGGKFNSVVMVDISIWETHWELSGDASPERPQGGLKKTSESPSEYSESLSEYPESPSRFDTSEEKRLLRTYVRMYVITLASCRP